MARLAVVMLIALVACGDDGTSPNDYSKYKCKAPSTDLPNGNHNPGMDCQGSCHDHGFTIAGTVFTDGTGTTPAVGATVNVYDGAQTLSMITATNGNFYTKSAVKLPFQVWVSSCPSVEIMPDSVDTNTGLGASCNQGICHNNGAGTGVITLNQ